MALGNAFQINVILFQSNAKKCWTTDLTDEKNLFRITLYFARSSSLHLDPIVPVQIDDSDIEIVDIIPGNGKSKYVAGWVKEEKKKIVMRFSMYGIWVEISPPPPPPLNN